MIYRIDWVLWLGLLLTTSVQAAMPVRAFTPTSMEKILHQQKGQPFVLIVWSLDCEFCLASLETLAAQKRRDARLQIVTLSSDPLADQGNATLIRRKLEKLSLRQAAWAYGEAPPEQLRYAIDPNWHGEMPRSYWFDAQGKGRAVSGLISQEMVTKFLAEQGVVSHRGIDKSH